MQKSPWTPSRKNKDEICFLELKITADGDYSHEIKRCLLLGKKAMTNPDSLLKIRDITLQTKVPVIKAVFFQESCMDKEDWAMRKWCFWTVVLEKTLESPVDSREIKPVNPKGNQHWIFIGRTDAEAEAPVFWPLMQTANSLEKDPVAGKDWRQRRRGLQRIRWLDSITNPMDINWSKL